jgi:hypothetical protein
MKYKEYEIQSLIGLSAYIVLDNEDGSFTSFTKDKNNPYYLTYLRWLEEQDVAE